MIDQQPNGSSEQDLQDVVEGEIVPAAVPTSILPNRIIELREPPEPTLSPLLKVIIGAESIGQVVGPEGRGMAADILRESLERTLARARTGNDVAHLGDLYTVSKKALDVARQIVPDFPDTIMGFLRLKTAGEESGIDIKTPQGFAQAIQTYLIPFVVNMITAGPIASEQADHNVRMAIAHMDLEHDIQIIRDGAGKEGAKKEAETGLAILAIQARRALDSEVIASAEITEKAIRAGAVEKKRFGYNFTSFIGGILAGGAENIIAPIEGFVTGIARWARKDPIPAGVGVVSIGTTAILWALQIINPVQFAIFSGVGLSLAGVAHGVVDYIRAGRGHGGGMLRNEGPSFVDEGIDEEGEI